MASVATPSRNVRAVLRLEARARQLLARYERALKQATQAKGQAHLLLDEADGLERALGDTEVGELHRERARAAALATTTAEATPDSAAAPPHGGSA